MKSIIVVADEDGMTKPNKGKKKKGKAQKRQAFFACDGLQITTFM